MSVVLSISDRCHYIRILMSEETIFDKIIRKQIPAAIVYEDQHVLAFKDVAPVANVHILVIPKNKGKLSRLSNADQKDQQLLGKLMVAAAKIMKEQKLEGYRIVINDGQSVGQTVFHLHVHIIGGGKFDWPPGVSKL